MGKKDKSSLKSHLPLLPAEEEVEVSDEDLKFIQRNTQYASFLNRLDTRTITKQVVGLLEEGKDEEALENYYENKRLKKKEGNISNLVDPVDVLPVKSLTGQLYYKTDSKGPGPLQQNNKGTSVESNVNEDASAAKSQEKLSKAERRKELKNVKKQAKKLAKEESQLAAIRKAPKSVLLEELKKDLSAEELFAQRKAHIAEIGTGLLADPEKNISTLKELVDMCSDPDNNISQLANLSALAIFKDIVPGYRVRLPTEKELQMKISMEVKKVRDFESTLLRCYQVKEGFFKCIGRMYDPETAAKVRIEWTKFATLKGYKQAAKADIKTMAQEDPILWWSAYGPKSTTTTLAIRLLSQTYLQKLITLGHVSSSRKVALRCMCCLLEAIPHFNYRDSLISAVIPYMSSTDNSIRNMTAAVVRSLFLNEGKHGGEATVEAVELIADFVKRHHCRLHPNTIEVFSSLSFDEGLGRLEESQLNAKKKRRAKEKNSDFRSGGPEKSESKVKKRQLASKLREEVEADFRAATSAPHTVERRRMQTQTIAAVFKTYFRILKCSIEPQTDGSYNPPNCELFSFGSGKHPLLVPCLDGLGRFSHLINVDFMGDLLRFLQRLASGDGASKNTSRVSSQLELTVLERLRCCIVAFKIVRSNLDALNIDLRDFFVQLYNILLECKPERDGHGQALSEALQIMLCEVRQHDMQRAAAFTKRLASLSLHFGAAEAMMALVTVKNLLHKYSKCRNLLENDGGGGSVGGTVAKYQPDAVDPELSGALSSILWEVALLSKHYHPAVSELANNIANMSVSHNQVFLSTLSPQEALQTYSTRVRAFSSPICQIKPTQKRKRNDRNSILDNSIVDQIKAGEDKDLVRKKFTTHFKVLRDIKENERLRKELNTTLSYLRAYDQYKARTGKKFKKATV